MLIIGAGFGGLGMARELQARGLDDITILERADQVGGVWRDNTYPGAACDVPSALYSWSWALNPTWPRTYSGQADILEYIQKAAADAGLLDLVHTGQDVTAVRYDDDSRTWTVTTAAGATYEADVVVNALGQLSNPIVPDLPGLESFAGPAFHSARWRHDVDLDGQAGRSSSGPARAPSSSCPASSTGSRAMTVFQRARAVRRLEAGRRVPRSPPPARGPLPAAARHRARSVFRLTELLNRALEGDS